MAEAKLKIDGMSCQHCVSAVKKALCEVTGVDSTEVEIGSAHVTFDDKKVTQKDLEKAVEKAGFTVKS